MAFSSLSGPSPPFSKLSFNPLFSRMYISVSETGLERAITPILESRLKKLSALALAEGESWLFCPEKILAIATLPRPLGGLLMTLFKLPKPSGSREAAR